MMIRTIATIIKKTVNAMRANKTMRFCQMLASWVIGNYPSFGGGKSILNAQSGE